VFSSRASCCPALSV